ncbi:MAG: PhnD/SsuA/transferrin family substrate-binding protein [Ardenticatenaceae bacterium]|nr:PhnD/SsuA/transferrin family substrate-binding protein [Anaerolineales bacterium]MCB8922813.1 PhnD/SsuA/transferrin family substrate-binding protein [Ardenticatenaceae bacterium]MCB8991946.1 PhnD/SsuA/transferrin family substrate-binding protein [Ardenticatenaceae bacterium]MCB9004756.1 PhnD/SsuA/transferrin family substrate-binding protein [Ardenticatenaceae bacterium]
MKKLFFLTLMISMLLAACQPQVFYVEATSAAPALDNAGTPASLSAPQVVEVTRLVSQEAAPPVEVTRMVTVTEEVAVEVTRSPLGSAERPIQLLFPPTYNSAIITSRGQVLADALAGATGLQFAIGVVDSEQALIDLMCMAPVDTVGVLSAMGYVLANEQCGVQLANTAVSNDGRTWQTGMIVTRRDSGLLELTDLADQSWAVPDLNSLPNFLYFQAMLLDAGIAPGEIVPVQGDNSAMLSVFNGDVDFATATYIPPILPYEEQEWVYGEDSPELWRALGISPTRSPIGYVLVLGEPQYGGYRLRDARSGIFDIEPGIYDQTRVITLSAQIPNEAVVLGADFPLGLARQVTALLAEFGASQACAESLCAGDFYAWGGLAPADDAAYEPLRFVIETLGLTEDEIWALR